MLELWGWNLGVDWIGALLLVGGALAIGIAAQLIGRPGFGYDWIFTSLAALVGGWLGSEAFGTLSTWGPEVGGLYVLPALIGAVLLGGIVDAIGRSMAGGTYVAHPV